MKKTKSYLDALDPDVTKAIHDLEPTPFKVKLRPRFAIPEDFVNDDGTHNKVGKLETL